jgi:hypothetical protein
MRLLIPGGLLLCIVGSALAQEGWPRPKFSDYSVRRIYQGKPAKPILNKDQRTFRTVIREGAKANVEFAGHYTIPRCGCGAGCSAFYLVDSVSGRVYDGFGVADPPFAWLEKHDPEEVKRIEFHPNSRLLKITGCPNERNCGFYDYVMIDGKGLKLVRKELLPKEFQ